MRYPPEIYAKAFFDVLVRPSSFGREDDLISNFIKIIIKNDDHFHFKKILYEIRRLIVRKDGGRNIVLEFARDVSGRIERQVKNYFDRKDFIDVRVNSDLIAGVRIIVDGEKEIDCTIRKKIKELLFQQG